MDLVSVVIPCYNQAQFLPEAIESVLAQTYRNFEIIVVDDGSTDNTSEVAHSYGLRCIRQKNQGLSAARNTGFPESTGKYLVFLDSDDRLLPNAFETALGHFAAHPECVFVSGRVREIAIDGSPHPTPEHPLIEKGHYLTLLQYCYICTSGAVMFNREKFLQFNGYNPSLMATGDWDLYLRVTRSFPVYNYNDLIAEYRRHGGQMTCNSAMMLRECLFVLRSQRRFLQQGDITHKKALNAGIRLIQEFYGEPLAERIRHDARNGEWFNSLRGLSTLLACHPRGFAKHFLPKWVRTNLFAGNNGPVR